MTGTKLRSPRVPAQRVYRGATRGPLLQRHSRAGGNPVLLFPCHPERSEGSGLTALKLRSVRLRAAIPPCPAMLGAARRGESSKAKATSKVEARNPILVIPAKAGIQGFGVRTSSFRIPA